MRGLPKLPVLGWSAYSGGHETTLPGVLAHLKGLACIPYDLATITPVRASKQFRVTLDTNRYSVPAEYASTRVTLKTYPDRLCIYHQEKLIARHARRYDRHQDIEDPDHFRALLEQRRNAREQKLLMRFLTLSPKAQEYYQELQQRRRSPKGCQWLKVNQALEFTARPCSLRIKLLLISDVLPDLFLFKSNGRDRVASGPKLLAVEIPLPSSKLPGHRNPSRPPNISVGSVTSGTPHAGSRFFGPS